jgi:glycosyltransferase involved in cell wall biosynthesis
MKVAVVHPGTQHSWQTAMALQQLERLEFYATSIFYQPDRWPYRLERLLPGPMGRRLHEEFRRFQFDGLDPALVETAGLAEWIERIAWRAGMRGLSRWVDRLGNRRFVHHLRARLEGPGRFALWGYSSGACTAFELAQRQGRPRILDRTIGDFRAYNAIIAELAQRYPEWFIPTELAYPNAVIENDQREYELADRILVGCEYAAQSVRQHGGPGIADRVQVLPYCFDEQLFGNQPEPRPAPRGAPVRFLFVGQANPRKGIHHLLEAISRIPPAAASLTIVGDLRIPRETFARYADRVTWVPTVARRAIPAIMAQHDVLVFPSYFEGSALSLIEGLASGLGVIQTRAAGNGATAATGIVLDEPDTEALAAAMQVAIDDRDRLDGWRAQAQAEAQRYSFAHYRAGIAAQLAEMEL